MKFAEVVADRIAALGVTHVFGLPGGQAMHLMDAVDRHPKLTYVTALHEQAAAFMAIGYAREKQSPAVVLVTTGPGGTNAITGLAGAWLDSIPVIFLSGQFRVETLDQSRGLRQSVLQQMFPISLVSPMTKFAIEVLDPNQAVTMLDKALSICVSGRPGPVWLDIPLDIQAADVSPELSLQAHQNLIPNLDDSLGVLQTMLDKSSRPALIAGGGVGLSKSRELLVEFCERNHLPILTSISGLDLVEDTHPLFYGRPNYWGQREANFIIQNCDLLISIGTGLHFEITGFDSQHFARGAMKVSIDVDKAEQDNKNLEFDLKIQADANVFLNQARHKISSKEKTNWIDYCNRVRERFKFDQFPRLKSDSQPNHYSVIEEISQLLPENVSVVYGNAGGHFTTTVQCFRVKKNQTLMSCIGIGAMGASIPMAIGAAFANPGKPIVVFTGDGGIQFNMQEIATIQGWRLPIHIFVFENQGYASLRSTQRRYFGGRLIASSPDSNLFLPAIAQVINAYKMPVSEVFKQSELQEQVMWNLMEHQALTVVHVDPECPIEPRLGSTLLPSGNMISDPLEDLSPHLTNVEFKNWMLIPSLRST